MVEYTCEACEFQTNLKKNYQRHLKTQKHIKAVGQTPPLEPTPEENIVEPPEENIVEPAEENIVEPPVEEERSDLEKPKRAKRKSYNSETALMKELEKQAQEEKQAVKKAPKKKKKKIIEVVEEESSDEEIIERRVIRKKKPAPRVTYEDDYREPTPIQPPPRLRRL
jgi:hypothetical protein